MRQKRWDLQLGETLHILHFERGRYRRASRQLLVDGQPAEALPWVCYPGRTPVVAYPFVFQGITLTVVVHFVRGKPSYDLLLDGISMEYNRPLDLQSLAQPKSKKDKFLEYGLYVALVIALRILMEYLARR
jgi:hypothetical protein